MDPQLQTLTIQLGDAAIRNTAASIAGRVASVKARKRDQETVAELEEIVNGLLADKSELVRIAQAYEDELVAQRISATDIECIAERFVPLVEQLASSVSDTTTSAQLALIRPLLSVEMVTVLERV